MLPVKVVWNFKKFCPGRVFAPDILGYMPSYHRIALNL